MRAHSAQSSPHSHARAHAHGSDCAEQSKRGGEPSAHLGSCQCCAALWQLRMRTLVCSFKRTETVIKNGKRCPSLQRATRNTTCAAAHNGFGVRRTVGGARPPAPGSTRRVFAPAPAGAGARARARVPACVVCVRVSVCAHVCMRVRCHRFAASQRRWSRMGKSHLQHLRRR